MRKNNSFTVIVYLPPIAIDTVTPMRFCCLTADDCIWLCCLIAVREQWRQIHTSDFFSPHKADM